MDNKLLDKTERELQQRYYGWMEKKQVPSIHIDDAKRKLWDFIKSYCGDDAQPYIRKKVGDEWTENKEPYQKVAEWMDDNKGKGLLLYGGCGTGKSMIAGMILPRLLYMYCKMVVTPIQSIELNNRYKYILGRDKTYLFVDDIGLEHQAKVYGENLGYVFSLLVDDAERKGNLLILTTNLQLSELREKYGERTFDRLRGMTKAICFDGKSFRG